jgi:phosphotransferase system  glucose/maltose/N-acetylglucosamine-specific IIC component
MFERYAAWLDSQTPVQAAAFTVIFFGAVYAILAFGLHWATNIVLWGAMTVIFAGINARRAWLRSRQDR